MSPYITTTLFQPHTSFETQVYSVTSVHILPWDIMSICGMSDLKYDPWSPYSCCWRPDSTSHTRLEAPFSSSHFLLSHMLKLIHVIFTDGVTDKQVL